MEVPHEFASPHTLKLAGLKSHKLAAGKAALPTGTRLVPNLLPKEEYVLHWGALQQALQMGFVMTSITAVVSYRQAAWMKPFVELCAGMRKKAQAEDNEPLSDVCKLMMNSAFGKTIEDPRGRLNIGLFSHSRRFDKAAGVMSGSRLALRRIMSERFTNIHKVSDDLFIITKKPKTAFFNKPFMTGQALLDYSKVHMLDMHYHIQAKYGMENVKLLATDTDSLIYLITCQQNLYQDMAKDLDRYDFSNMKSTMPSLYSDEHRAEPGRFKSVWKGLPIHEGRAACPKVYALTGREEDKEHPKGSKENPEGTKVVDKITCKGVKKSARDKMSMDTFKGVIEDGDVAVVTQSSIQNRRFKLVTVEQTKVGFTAVDIKRYWLDDGLTSLPHGHYKTPSFGWKA
jgi:hypothetical protein